MGEMLSQDEINALLGGALAVDDDAEDNSSASDSMSDVSAYVTPNLYDDALTSIQKDILGEIGNISMGTSATTLYALLNHKVWITTPKVNVLDWGTLSGSYDRPCVGIRVDYKEGLRGSNILILKEHDVKIIADLMMGGDGAVSEPVVLTDLDLSAIGEAMNQMVGSSSTSISSMVKMKIDIDTPQPFILNFADDSFFDTIGFKPEEIIACISFKMEIGSLIDSEIMQILPIDFAIDMVEKLKNEFMGSAAEPAPPSPTPSQPAPQTPPASQILQQAVPPITNAASMPAYNPYPPQNAIDPSQQQQPYGQQPYQQPYVQQPYGQPPYQQPYVQPPYGQPPYQQPYMQQTYPIPDMPAQNKQENINVQTVQFPNFDVGSVIQQKENMNIIMDVPLEVTVELGRTHKKIKEILEFVPGTLVILDKLAGEPVDIFVNGKLVATGEVVVLDENFGIRIGDIISADKRI